MQNTIKKIAIQDASSPGDIVFLSNIMEGVEGAASFGYTEEITGLKVEDNQTQNYLRNGILDVRVIQSSDSDLAILDDLINNQKKARVTAITIDGFVIFEREVLLYRAPYFNSNIISDQIYIKVSDNLGYSGTAPNTRQAFYGGDNALALYKVRVGSSLLLNGFQKETGVDSVVIGSSQTINVYTAQQALLSNALLFPFPGENLTVSFNVTEADITYRLGVRFLDSASSVLSNDYTTFSSTGRITHSATVPASTVYVQFYVTNDGSVGASEVWNLSTEVWSSTELWWNSGNNEQLTFDLPALRITGTQFVD